jgi:hypothetical protein
MPLSAAARILRRVSHALGFRTGADPALPPDVDPATAGTVRAVRRYTMTSELRLVALCDAVRHVVQNRIAGDIVECGVWRGGSMMAVARTLLELGDTSRHLYLFDTYDGMTEPGDADVSISGESAAALMRSNRKADPTSVWCYSPLAEVEAVMRSVGYPAERIHFIEGRVEETLPRRAPEHIALLRLDTDWYESTRHELVHLYPRLNVGGVLIVDDYGHWKGARRAVDEYLAESGAALYLQRIDYTGRSAVKWRP